MARVFIDGFEGGDLGLWENHGFVIASPEAGMSGDWCAYCNGSSNYIDKVLPSSNEYYFSFRSRSTSDSYRHICGGYLDATKQWHLQYSSASSRLEIYYGGTLAATGVHEFRRYITYHIEIYVLIANENGRFVVKLNGVTDIDYTGDTQGSDTSNQMDRIRFGSFGGTTGTSIYVDDVIVDDSNFPGDTRIQKIAINGAGTTTQWTPSIGVNYQCVDEIPADDADYVYTNTVDQIDSYNVTSLEGEIESVKCIQVQARAKKEGLSTPQNLQLGVRTNAIDYFGGSQALESDYKGFSEIWESNPATSSAWTKAVIDDLEIGIKSIA
jgi:hypothetical protein